MLIISCKMKSSNILCMSRVHTWLSRAGITADMFLLVWGRIQFFFNTYWREDISMLLSDYNNGVMYSRDYSACWNNVSDSELVSSSAAVCLKELFLRPRCVYSYYVLFRILWSSSFLLVQRSWCCTAEISSWTLTWKPFFIAHKPVGWQFVPGSYFWCFITLWNIWKKHLYSNEVDLLE